MVALDSLRDLDWEVPAFDLHELAPRRTRYCVCIPVINEGERLIGQLDEMRRLGLTRLADTLILDGGSTDGSTARAVLAEAGVRALLVKTGAGRLSAQLRMGYAYAMRQGYAGVVTVDGNGKDGVEAIPDFIRELEAGVDLVQGSRYVPGGRAVNTPLVRAAAIKLIHSPVISLAAGFRYTDTTNGFRGYSRRLLTAPEINPFRDVFSTYELIAYLSVSAPRRGFRVKEVPVTRRYPAHGKTPTKISHFRGNLLLLGILCKTLTGAFDPR
jgi:dolichol-phosphate mannosyltransferase